MAKKIYKLMQRRNQVSFTLIGKSGNQVRFNFTQGNAAVGQPARLILTQEYYQQMLEDSDLFKRGLIKVERVEEDKKSAKKIEEKKEMKKVDEVKTAADAIEYVANEFGEVAKTKAEAKRIAADKGVEFPNLK